MSPKLTGTLMVLPEHVKARPVYPGLYAAPVGSGPKGETCGSCKHLFRNRMARVYLKCALTRAKWTGGGGTDIKARAPACAKWELPPKD